MRPTALVSVILLLSFGCVDEKAQDDSNVNAESLDCSFGHVSCPGEGEPNCSNFGAEEGLAFSGRFISECDEANTDCGPDATCVGNFACGSDAPCPGLCVDPVCMI
jgi:hypothetical protein